MSTALAPEPAVVETHHDDDLDHIMCCRDDDLALCGRDISDHELLDDDELFDEESLCIVCDHLADDTLQDPLDCAQACPAQAPTDPHK